MHHAREWSDGRSGRRRRAGQCACRGGGGAHPVFAGRSVAGAACRCLEGGTERDGALRRLLPDAYRSDPELADEWRQLSRRGLVDRKIGFARTLSTAVSPIAAASAADSVALTESDALDWVRGVGDLRLVIAERMGIIVDGDEGSFAEPGLRDVYDWLGWLQDSLVRLLEGDDASSAAEGPR